MLHNFINESKIFSHFYFYQLLRKNALQNWTEHQSFTLLKVSLRQAIGTCSPITDIYRKNYWQLSQTFIIVDAKVEFVTKRTQTYQASTPFVHCFKFWFNELRRFLQGNSGQQTWASQTLKTLITLKPVEPNAGRLISWLTSKVNKRRSRTRIFSVNGVQKTLIEHTTYYFQKETHMWQKHYLRKPCQKNWTLYL